MLCLFWVLFCCLFLGNCTVCLFGTRLGYSATILGLCLDGTAMFYFLRIGRNCMCAFVVVINIGAGLYRTCLYYAQTSIFCEERL